jgi:hypothetical protein
MIIPEYGPCDPDHDPDDTIKPSQPIPIEETKIVESVSFVDGKMCYKCKVSRATLLNKQDKTCKDCLM